MARQYVITLSDSAADEMESWAGYVWVTNTRTELRVISVEPLRGEPFRGVQIGDRNVQSNTFGPGP